MGSRLGSVRARAAIVAALATVIVFGAGIWWIRGSVRDQIMSNELRSATNQAATLTNSQATGEPPVGVDDESWIVDAEGRGVSGLSPFMLAGRRSLLPPAVGWTTRTMRMPKALEPSLGGRKVTFVVGTTHILSSEQLQVDGDPPGQPPQRLTVYMLVSPKNADTAVASIDRVLGWGLLVAVPFVGLIAWFAAGRALRPVEAIRRKMAKISAEALDQRVPVPATGDEITRLALTTNETLERLELALRRQVQFVANASHELRSPLANLRNALEVPLHRPEEADWPVIVADALADTTRLQGLTDDLLLLADTGRRPPQEGETTDLADLVEEQVGERSYLDGSCPAFVARISRPAVVPGAEVRIGRIVRNLLDNAAKYARETVTATVTVDDAHVVLNVSDDGPGVPAAERERIFERFVRLDDARARATGGSGLGLTIARGIAEEVGGTIVVDDSGFRVRLPLVTDG